MNVYSIQLLSSSWFDSPFWYRTESFRIGHRTHAATSGATAHVVVVRAFGFKLGVSHPLKLLVEIALAIARDDPF